jgi:hypothetical protein
VRVRVTGILHVFAQYESAIILNTSPLTTHKAKVPTATKTKQAVNYYCDGSGSSSCSSSNNISYHVVTDLLAGNQHFVHIFV